jgi:2-keto-4-pentenoate hydratase/2-oxohepta-3-ene-1,7-dioic acid hydratase in catechol pathway
MKLASFRNHSGKTRVGVVVDNRLVDLTAAFERYLVDECGVAAERAVDVASTRLPTSMLDLLRREEEGWADLSTAYSFICRKGVEGIAPFSPGGSRVAYGMEEVRLLTPIPQLYRVFNIGNNSSIFSRKIGTSAPEENVTCMFKKTPRSIIGPGDDIQWPATGNDVVTELELGVVIGKRFKGISQSRAHDCIFGYVVLQDLAVLDVLTRAHWGPGDEGLPAQYYMDLCKTPDTFQPVGPFLVTKDEIPDCQSLNMELRVNGKPTIRGSTRDMRVPISRQLEFLSADMTFLPGDLIASGSMGSDEYPPIAHLAIGDELEAEIEGVGVLKNRVVG